MATYNWTDGELLTASKLNSWSAEIEGIKDTAMQYRDDAEEFKDSALASKNASAQSEANALDSENKAKTSETNAKASETTASGYVATTNTNKLDSEAWAVGTRGGVPVGASDPAYHNNAKYYKDQAGQIVGNDYVRSVNDVLPDENGNVDVESDVFVVGTVFMPPALVRVDKQKEDLDNALNNNNVVLLKYNSTYYSFVSTSSTSAVFSTVLTDGKLSITTWTFSNSLVTVKSISKENAPTISTRTLLASAWTDGAYSFESTYPVASYNMEVELDGDSATEEQIEAWSGAKMVGSATANKLYAKGDVPAVDIPVIVKVVAK